MKTCSKCENLASSLINRAPAVVSRKENTTKLPFLLLLLVISPATTDARAIQHKACSVSPCTLDEPVTAGDLLVVVTQFACIPIVGGGDCNTVSDVQGNTWKIAIVVPNSNGTPLYYAVNAKGGPDSIHFHGWRAIVAEYPPSLGLDDSNWGQYGIQITHDEVGASNDVGWTMPVQTSYDDDLLIAWSAAGANQPNAFPVSGPYFTVVDSADSTLALEDAVAGRPGLYMGTMSWDSPTGGVYAHWTMGLAAFRMGTIEIENPSFEEISAPLMPSYIGPWNNGPIPGWSQSGNTGLWQPAAGVLGAMQVPDGKTLVWMDTGAISQDLGDTSAKPYTLSVSIGNRYADGTWTISLYAGTTVLCTTSGSLSAIPPGSFARETLSCNVPAGDLTIGLALQGHAALDNVRLTTTEPSTPIKIRRSFQKLENPRRAESPM